MDEVDTQIGDTVDGRLEDHWHTLLAKAGAVCIDVVQFEGNVVERAAATFQPALQWRERSCVVALLGRNDELELAEQIAIALELRDVAGGHVSSSAVLPRAREVEQRLEQRLTGTDNPDV